MTDHGILFDVHFGHGRKVRVPLADVITVHTVLQGPDAPASAPAAVAKLGFAIHRADEARHFVLSDDESGAVAWAIEAMMRAQQPVSDELHELRHAVLPASEVGGI